MVRKLLLTLSVLLVGGSLLTFGINAVFTDTASVPGNTFSTGNVDISTSPTSALVTFSDMMPGDVVTAPLTVTNAGGGQLRYAVPRDDVRNPLADQRADPGRADPDHVVTGGFGASG